MEAKSLAEARALCSSMQSARDAAAAAHAQVETELLNAEASLAGLLLTIFITWNQFDFFLADLRNASDAARSSVAKVRFDSNRITRGFLF